MHPSIATGNLWDFSEFSDLSPPCCLSFLYVLLLCLPLRRSGFLCLRDIASWLRPKPVTLKVPRLCAQALTQGVQDFARILGIRNQLAVLLAASGKIVSLLLTFFVPSMPRATSSAFLF